MRKRTDRRRAGAGWVGWAVVAGVTVLWGGVVPRAQGETVVWFDFSGSGLTAEQQQDILRRVHAKYEFTVDDFNVGTNLRFVKDNPGGDNPHRVVFDNRIIAQAYGVTRGNTSTVFRRKLTEGHWRNWFDTKTRQNNSLVDTAAHELGHQFIPGHGHNCHAPNERTEVTDADGDTYVRTPGDGTLVNGRPGLMCRGDKVVPAEHRADLREFTDAERRTIARFLQRAKQGRNNRPRGSGTNRMTDLQFIEGRRFNGEDPSDQPPWTEPFPMDREDHLVDLVAFFEGNEMWEFGYATDDGGFWPIVGAGEPSGHLGFEPGQIADFAILQVGANEQQRLTMSEVGQVVFLGKPVPWFESVDPPVNEDYFRQVVLEFNPGGNPGLPPVRVAIEALPGPDFFDGFRLISTLPGDCDGDGDVDIADFSTFAACFAGSGVAVPPECACADLDGDGDVDIVDFGTFSGAFTGSQ